MEISLLDEWKHELNALKVELYELGDKPDSFKYNVLSAEALRLSQCIIDLLVDTNNKER